MTLNMIAPPNALRMVIARPLMKWWIAMAGMLKMHAFGRYIIETSHHFYCWGSAPLTQPRLFGRLRSFVSLRTRYSVLCLRDIGYDP
jgi:hypothetical protein